MDATELLKEKKDVVDRFRERIKDTSFAGELDVELLRWLIARNYDLNQAESMLRTSLNWKEKNKIDELVETFQTPEALTKFFPLGQIGRDKLGCSLWIVSYGRVDMKGLLMSVKKKDYYNFVFVKVTKGMMQMAEDRVRLKLGDSMMMQMTVIFDMHDFSMKHVTHKPSLETMLYIIQMYEANCPELLRRVFVINAPRVFTLAWNIIKPLLRERTRQKVQIFGTDAAVYQAAILQDVDADQLPAFYGGTLTDPNGDPRCLTMMNMGGKVPKSYYRSNTKSSLGADAKKITVASGSKKSIEFQVDTTDRALRWAFQTTEGDIAFAVYLKKANGEMVDVVASERVDSHLATEEGEIPCNQLGLYVFEFDNSFSYVRSKEVTYSISVVADATDAELTEL